MVTSLGGGAAKKKKTPPVDIMSMTPAEKQDYLSKRKLQHKKEDEEYANKKDPKTLILERKEPACKAYLTAKQGNSSPVKEKNASELDEEQA